MAKKRKPARNGKLRPQVVTEELEARLRARYGDKKFEYFRDRQLTDSFFEGQALVDENGALVDYQFLSSGSPREQEAMAEISQILISVYLFIASPEIWPQVEKFKKSRHLILALSVLPKVAGMIEPDRPSMWRLQCPRKFATQARYDGKLLNRRREWLIADRLAREVKAGTQITAAYKLIGERFDCSAKTVERIWKRQRRAALERVEANQTFDLSDLETASAGDKSKPRLVS